MDALSLTQQLFFFMDYINKCLFDPAQHLMKLRLLLVDEDRTVQHKRNWTKLFSMMGQASNLHNQGKKDEIHFYGNQSRTVLNKL